MDKIFDNKNILVTGGTGSIGEEIVKRLLKENVGKIITLGREENKNFFLERRLHDKRVKCITGDIRDTTSIRSIFIENDIDIVYHAAAMKHVSICEKFPLESVKTNVFGTYNLIELAKEYNVKKLITVSTDKAVNPVNVMGSTKLLAEKITLNAGYSCVRFGNVANSKGSVIPALIDDLINGNSLIVTDPNVTRFIMRISEAADLVIDATKYSEGGEIFVLKMKAFKLSDMVEVIEKIGKEIFEIKEKDIKIKYLGLIAGEKIHEDLINSIEQKNVYDLGNMYAIFPLGITPSNKVYKKIELNDYNSSEAELISKIEVENIVREYVDMLDFRYP